MSKKISKGTAQRVPFIRNVVPDKLDLRDRVYQPTVAVAPASMLVPRYTGLPVLNQGDCNACTGFALSSMVGLLLRKAGHKPAEAMVSPYMLYSMARRYDEFPGSPDVDSGSSLRGAMKGWYKHGACAARLWDGLPMPDAPPNDAEDWWLDAVRRPLGAYYRVDTRSVTDMHVALNEVGVLYASAICHAGWDAGLGVKVGKGSWWKIPPQKAMAVDGGHAFVIVGYNSEGFIIQNSWGREWGDGGHAVLTYEDWLDNAMDCWVAQIGVVTELHEAIAQASGLRTQQGVVQLAASDVLRARELGPYIIDMENNGRLSNTGVFRTQDADITALVTQQMARARMEWGLSESDVVDVAIYAHGGLVSEGAAAACAARWIPALYANRIFPIFLMWETGGLDTLRNRLEDVLRGQPRPAGGVLEAAYNWYNERLERLFVQPGSLMWCEMKQNADALSGLPQSGGRKLYEACRVSPWFAPGKVRLHLIGHSAGSTVHSHLVERLGTMGWDFETVNFMAPAVRVDTFKEKVLPAIKSGKVKRYHQFHLDDVMEQKDPTCKMLLGYGRSLLYLVAQSFEQGVVTPILGMQKYFDAQIAPLKLANMRAWLAPGSASKTTTHGGFDDDATTMQSIIALIQGADEL